MISFDRRYFEDINNAYEYIVNNTQLENKKVLLTGGTGLIGSAIAHILLEAKKNSKLNLELYLCSRNVDKLNDLFARWVGYFVPVKYDLNDKPEFDFAVDFIIHCAGNAHPQVYAEHPVDTLFSTISGTNNLLDYARNQKNVRFLYVSSSEVYGINEKESLFKEEDYGFVDILNPRASYPSAKRASETLCSAYIQEHNLDVVIVRPGHIYGPTMTQEDSRAHAQFARNVISGQDIVMKSEGKQLRSYCHAIDCATAILTVLLCGQSQEAYNISNKDSIVTIRKFAEMHANLTGREVKFELPKEEEKKGYNMMPCSALNSDKLYNLGWKGIYNLEDGVRETLEILMCKKL